MHIITFPGSEARVSGSPANFPGLAATFFSIECEFSGSAVTCMK